MNLNTLVVETERKARFLDHTQNLVTDERAQRIRTAEVQSALFVKKMLARLRQESLSARQKQLV